MYSLCSFELVANSIWQTSIFKAAAKSEEEVKVTALKQQQQRQSRSLRCRHINSIKAVAHSQQQQQRFVIISI